MSQKDDFQTIDPTALQNVAGGAGTTTGTTDDALMTALSGILDSVQQLGQNNNQMGMPEMMMMMMAMNNRSSNNAAAAASPPFMYPWGYAYYY